MHFRPILLRRSWRAALLITEAQRYDNRQLHLRHHHRRRRQLKGGMAMLNIIFPCSPGLFRRATSTQNVYTLTPFAQL